jgi:cysteine-rich repeat protein
MNRLSSRILCCGSLCVVVGGCFSPNVPAKVGATGQDGSGGSSSEGSGPISDTTGPSSGTDGDVTGNDVTETTQDAESGTASSDSSETSGGEGGPLCGNGAPDPGEACDDGDDVNGNGCNNDCVESGTLLWEVDAGAGYVVESSEPVAAPERVATRGESVAVLLTSNDGPDQPAALVRQYDGDGTLEWSDQWGMPDSGIVPSDVVIASDDAVVVSAVEVFGVGGANIGHVRRYGVLGTEAWSLEIVDADYVVPAAVAAADLGEVLVGGSTSGPSTAWVRRYSPAGREVLHDSGPRGQAYTAAIRVVEDGGYIVCSGQAFLGGGGGASISRYTENGVEDWNFTIPEVDLVGCDADASGAIAIAGRVGDASWVGRAQGEGTVDWSVLAEGTGGAEVNAVALDADGNLVAGGTLFDPTDGDPNAIRWLRKFDAAGTLLWERQFDFSSEQPERIADVSVDDADNIYVVGRRDDVGGPRAWLAKLTP